MKTYLQVLITKMNQNYKNDNNYDNALLSPEWGECKGLKLGWGGGGVNGRFNGKLRQPDWMTKTQI